MTVTKPTYDELLARVAQLEQQQPSEQAAALALTYWATRRAIGRSTADHRVRYVRREVWVDNVFQVDAQLPVEATTTRVHATRGVSWACQGGVGYGERIPLPEGAG